MEKDINTVHVWICVCVYVSEKGCTKILSWEHPVSDPCLSNCVERTFSVHACMRVSVKEEEEFVFAGEKERDRMAA